MKLLYGASSKPNHLGTTDAKAPELKESRCEVPDVKTIKRKSHVDPGVLTARYAIAPR